MKKEAVTDALLRQFLLGRLEDEERQRQRIESLFITDSHTKERVLAAEQELIDDYLEDRLSTADREAFLLLYGDTVAQRRKLRIAKSIQDWVARQPNTTPVDRGPEISVWDRLRARLKPSFVLPIAITTAVAIVIAVVWVNSRNERHRQYLAVQQEVTRLNTPSSLHEVPSQILLTLKPGSGRSLDPQPELKIHPDSSVAELRLLLMQKEDYPTYEAVVRGPRDDQSYIIPNLTAAREDGKFIRVRLPAQLLTRGTHHIELSGVTADGAKSPPEVYSLTVSE